MRKLAAVLWFFLRQEGWFLALGLAALLASLVVGLAAPRLWSYPSSEVLSATSSAAALALALLAAPFYWGLGWWWWFGGR